MMRAACPKDKLEMPFFSSPVNPALAGRQLIRANYLKGLSITKLLRFRNNHGVVSLPQIHFKTFTTSDKTLM